MDSIRFRVPFLCGLTLLALAGSSCQHAAPVIKQAPSVETAPAQVPEPAPVVEPAPAPELAPASVVTAREIQPKPIHVLAWNIDEMGRASPYGDSPNPNITQFFWLYESTLTNIAMAKQMTDRQPEGRRVMFSWDLHRRMYTNPKDQLTTKSGEKFTAYWWNHGVEDTLKAFDAFFREYHALGGKLDYFILDTEHDIGADINTPERWEAVARDPRFKGILRDIGRTSHTEFDGPNKPGAHGYWRYCHYRSWQYFGRIYNVIRVYYPDVKFSDYCSYNQLTELVAWGRFRFDELALGQYGLHAGTHQSPSLYGVITYLGDIEVDGKKFGLGPYRSLMLSANQGRASRLSSPVPFAPWFAWRGYRTDFEDKPAGSPPRSSFGNTDYYQENVFHAVLLDPDFLLLWSACRWRQDQKAEDWCQAEHLKLMDQMVDQINGLIGFSDRKTLVDRLAPWHGPFLLTGAVANGQSVWRLTPDPDQSKIALSDILVAEDPLTFQLGDQTLVLPGAKVLREEAPLSSVGYWILGPKDLVPQITIP